MITLTTKEWGKLLILTKEDVYHPQIDEGFIIRGGSQVLYDAHVAVLFDADTNSIEFLKNRYEIGDIEEEITDFIKAWHTPNKLKAHELGLF